MPVRNASVDVEDYSTSAVPDVVDRNIVGELRPPG